MYFKVDSCSTLKIQKNVFLTLIPWMKVGGIDLILSEDFKVGLDQTYCL